MHQCQGIVKVKVVIVNKRLHRRTVILRPLRAVRECLLSLMPACVCVRVDLFHPPLSVVVIRPPSMGVQQHPAPKAVT